MRFRLWLIPLQMNMFILPICAVLLAAAAAAPAGIEFSRDEAAAAAQRLTDARVLTVERSEAAQRPVWRVKVVTAQGDVRVILMDAVSGHVL